MKKISVITINYNTPAMTEKAVRAFKISAAGFDYEIILIDNNSDKKVSGEVIKKLDLKYIVNNQNLGFAKAVNQGIKAANAEYILLLNSDVIVKPGAVADMLKYLEKEERVGIVGPKFIYPGGANQLSSGKFPNFWRELLRFTTLYKILPFGIFNKDFKNLRSVDWLSGGCMLIRIKLIRQIGMFDENYFFGTEDKDFCLRAKAAGSKVIYYPKPQVTHCHGLSSGGRRSVGRLEMEREAENYFLRKNFKKKIISRFLIRRMYDAKILVFNLFEFGSKTKKYQPIDATVAVTYKCNSRCKMCNIWQTENPTDLPINYFYNLSKSLKYINISGGEAFLRPDLPEIIKIIKHSSPRAQIIISSNGLASELIVKSVKQILTIDKGIGIRISLDGIGRTHDEIRGVNGAYQNVLKTVVALKDIGVKNLGFSFTIMDDNAGELKAVYDLAKSLGLELALALVQNSEIYFNKDNNKLKLVKAVEENLKYIIRHELKSWNLKRWLRAYYDYGLLYFVKYKERLLPSGAGKDSLFIDPEGCIYPSNLINLKIGKLSEESLDKTWNSRPTQLIRHKIKEENISESWIICTIRGEMKRNLHKIVYWIIKNKFFVNL
ncbi:MAG: glycosyltransferase [Candidatus Falkowbacteria bacterium]